MADALPLAGGVHRPRNVDWKRAAALLYGDWGTSKAYVIGLAFVAAGFSSLPIILAVCALTGLVGINYAVICAYFPDGGGVYSAARSQGRLLAVVGALLLIADLTVTAALSGWSGLTYVISGAEDILWLKFLKDHIAFTTIGVLIFLGCINWFGPKHSRQSRRRARRADRDCRGRVDRHKCTAFDHTFSRAAPRKFRSDFGSNSLASFSRSSGVEAIANLTGVMKLDPGSTPEQPKVAANRDQSDLAGSDRGCVRHCAARLGHAFAAASWKDARPNDSRARSLPR